MNEDRSGFSGVAAFVGVVLIAAGARAWYLWECADAGSEAGPLQVQGPTRTPGYPPGTKLNGTEKPEELDALVHNLIESNRFACLAPFATEEETTAHVAPGYPWLCSMATRWLDNPKQIVRWGQCALGALAAGCYFAFACRAFRSVRAGILAGLLTALHPFWIINTAELNDGVAATFLLSVALLLGTHAVQTAGAAASLLFGLTMAALAMVRAAFLPFTVLGVLWFVLRCRSFHRGWFAALLAFLGFATGLAPSMVRNYRVFGQPIPVADAALLHFWIGNNPKASGGSLDETTYREALGPERTAQVMAESNQARRYTMLGEDALQEILNDPGTTLRRRLLAGLDFAFGEAWFANHELAIRTKPGQMPSWLSQVYAALLTGALLLMASMGLLGWRWSFGWRKESRLATLAAVWGPLPYILGHAEFLSGPRLPLDGVCLSYAAFALACLLPGTRKFPPRPQDVTAA
jgi:4-amino-4-deoxy-L-arabinose transferase-like glycosyltransferase